MWIIHIEFHMSTHIPRTQSSNRVSEQIRSWRNHFGLTQAQLEERAGLAHNAVSRIENVEVSPRLETVESLASAMSLSVEQLQFGHPRSETSPRRARARIKESNSIIGKLASLPPEKAAKATEAIHRILDLLE